MISLIIVFYFFSFSLFLYKGLHFIQMRSGLGTFSRSSLPIQSLSASLNQRRETLTPSTTLASSVQVSPLQQHSFQHIQSPLASSQCLLSSSNNSTFILRKRINFLTKYNLTSLLRDFEMNLRDSCKCEISTVYFSFKASSDLKKRSKQPTASKFESQAFEDEKTDSVFLEDLKLLDTESQCVNASKSKNRSKLYRKFSYNQSDKSPSIVNFELLDDCDSDNDFRDLK